MINPLRLQAIYDIDYIFDTLRVERRRDVFDIFDTTLEHLFTGNADSAAKFLNKYFGLDRYQEAK